MRQNINKNSGANWHYKPKVSNRLFKKFSPKQKNNISSQKFMKVSLKSTKYVETKQISIHKTKLKGKSNKTNKTNRKTHCIL